MSEEEKSGLSSAARFAEDVVSFMTDSTSKEKESSQVRENRKDAKTMRDFACDLKQSKDADCLLFEVSLRSARISVEPGQLL